MILIYRAAILVLTKGKYLRIAQQCLIFTNSYVDQVLDPTFIVLVLATSNAPSISAKELFSTIHLYFRILTT